MDILIENFKYLQEKTFVGDTFMSGPGFLTAENFDRAKWFLYKLANTTT